MHLNIYLQQNRLENRTLRTTNLDKGKTIKSPFCKIIVNETNIEKCHDFIDKVLFLIEPPYKIFYAQLQVSQDQDYPLRQCC